MVIAADYPFMDVLWSMIIFFCWIIWIWMMIVILTDVFRRDDIGGVHKALWIVFLIILPFLGVLIYLIAQHNGMQERGLKDVQRQQAAFDAAVRQAAGSGGGGGAATELANAKQLLDSGVITQAEFDQIKAKALAAA